MMCLSENIFVKEIATANGKLASPGPFSRFAKRSKIGPGRKKTYRTERPVMGRPGTA